MAKPDSREEQDKSRDNKGRFKKGFSGNKGGRSSKSAQLRTLLETGADEAVNQVIDAAQNGDLAACRLILDRVVPPSKPIYPPIPFDLDDSNLPATAKSIIRAVSEGILPADHAKILLDSLASVAKVIEITELTQRMDELEKYIKEN